MKGWITLTHYFSQNKLHIQVSNVIGFKEAEKANLLMIKAGKDMYVSESMEEIFTLIKMGEEE